MRSVLWRLGYRYRLQRRDLPGCPDIVLPRYRAAIFIHGCFWHQHKGCEKGRPPRTRSDYWVPKLARNRERDAAAMRALEGLGWRVIVIWQCELRNEQEVRDRLLTLLSSPQLTAPMTRPGFD